jgi:radical SAM protein with 4Fe4S-binding SPASM domain
LQEIFEDTCSFLYADLNVEPDGGISPCCFNHSKKWDMGRVEELADFRSFWNNPHLKAMRGYYGGKGDGGMELLCRYCEFVGNGKTDDRNREGRLSPLPPSFIADGIEFIHEYGDRTALVQIER